MHIKQFFDKESSTYTYLIISAQKNTAIIDPVFDQIPTYSKLIHELNINLHYSIDTHIHADHRSASANSTKILDAQPSMEAKKQALPCKQFATMKIFF